MCCNLLSDFVNQRCYLFSDNVVLYLINLTITDFAETFKLICSHSVFLIIKLCLFMEIVMTMYSSYLVKQS